MVVERDALGFDAPAPLEHPARKGLPQDREVGPKLGERLPDFSLPDAFGRTVNFHAAREGQPAAVVFFRSAVW